MGLEDLIEKGYKKVGNIGKSFAKKTAVLAFGACLAATSSYASDKQEIYGKVALGNCLLQGVISGFGGMQNGKSYWESFGKGCLGGALVAGGKIAVGNDLNNAWPAKMATALGTSISYNASNGKPMDDSLGFDFGPAFFEWKKNESGDYKFKTFLLPDSLAYAMNFASKGAKLDAEKSLRYGNPIFTSKNFIRPYADGTTGANNVAILKNTLNPGEEVLRHELIHTFQYASSRPTGNVVLSASNFTKGTQDLSEKYHLKIDNLVGHHLFQSVNLFEWDKSKTPQEREAYGLTE